MATACNFCRGDGHNCAGDVAIAATRNIAACRIHGDRFLPRDQARCDLVFDVCERRFLGLGKAFHIVMGELDIFFQFLRHKVASGLDFGLCQDDITVVFVEFRRIFARLVVAAGLDVRQDALDQFVHVGCAGLRGEGRFFQIITCHVGPALFVNVRKHGCRNRRDKGDHKHDNQHEENEGHGAPCNFENGFAGDAGNHKQVQA